MSASNYFIDTNIFLRIFVKIDNKKFQECLDFLNLIESGEIKAYTSSIVLAEAVWTLNSFYKFKKSEIIKSLKSILILKNLKFKDNLDFKKAIKFYSENNIKFTDCLIASDKNLSAKKTILISYDKDFDKLPIKRLEPKDILRN